MTEVGRPTPEQFCQAVKRGDMPEVIKMTQRGANMNDTSHGMTPLIWAAAKGHHQILQHLIRHGARVNDKNSLAGDTALHRAASAGYKGIVDVLLKEKADINAVNTEGDTPIMSAISNGRADVVALLIERGADLTIYNKGHETALSIAKRMKREEIIPLLEEADRLRADFAAAASHEKAVEQQENLRAKAVRVRLKPGPKP